MPLLTICQATFSNVKEAVVDVKPPTDPYKGLSWTDTSKTPPVTKVWDGTKWVDSIADAVNGIEVGGRNLALNTKEFGSPWTNSNSGSSVYVDEDTGIKYRKIWHSTTSSWANYITQYINFEPNTEYTVSLFVRKNTDINPILCARNDRNAAITAFAIDAKITSRNWVRLNWTSVTVDGSSNEPFRIFARCTSAGGNDTGGALNADSAIDIALVKVEKGNKATDWTPAPEDTQSEIDAANVVIQTHTEKLSTHDTRITSTEAAINLRVTREEYEEYKTTVNGELALTESRLSASETSIAALQDEISLKVTQTEIDTAVQNIQIGGRNLLRNTNFAGKFTVTSWDTGKNGNYSASYWGGYNGGVSNPTTCYHAHLEEFNGEWVYNFTKDAETWLGISQTLQGAVKMRNNQTYTLSFEIYRPSGSKNYCSAGIHCYANSSATSKSFVQGQHGFVPTIYDAWVKLSWTFTTNATIDFTREHVVYIYGHGGTGTIRVRRIMLEEGSKASAWQLSPEDIDASIIAVNNRFADYSTTTQMQAAITAAKDSITQSVSETYATKTQVNTVSGNVTTLTSRVSAAESKLTKDGLVTTIGSYYATQTALDTTNNNVSAAQAAADAAYNLADAKGIDYSQGKMMHTDPMFASGENSCSVYNNSKNGTVTVIRTAKSSDNPMIGTDYELAVKTAGTASPGLGGYVQTINSRANAVFIRRIIAKIPIGYSLACGQNSMGTGYTVQWLTPNVGTGNFTEYVYKYVCGPSGTFSTGGHVYLNGAAATSESPITWYVAYSTTFDMTNVSNAILAQTIATQTQEKFNWIVKSGTSATDFTLTDRTATLIANAINLNGLVTFSGLDSVAQNKIMTAQTTADMAKTNAATAQSTANTAKTNAATAVSNAANAQSTANTANTRATYHYGTCSTAAATVAKVVTLSGFALYTGAIVNVKFTNANTAASPTLNVNGTGAKPIYVYDAALAASSSYNWVAGSTVQFIYNGTQWVMSDTSAMKAMANWCYSNNISYINGGKIYAGTVTASQIAANAVTTDKLAANAVTAEKIAAKSITADKIDVNDLFAQEITATGTITGATLISTDGSRFKIEINNGALLSESTIPGSALESSLNISNGFISVSKGSLEDYLADGSEYCYAKLNASGMQFAHNNSPLKPWLNIDMENERIVSTGHIVIGGEFVSESHIGLRIASGNYGSFIYNNYDHTFFLLTNYGDLYGTFNNLRPLYFRNSDGQVYLEKAASVTSDERDKDILGAITDDSRYEALFMSLEPIRYRWKNHSDDRIQLGLGAQTTARKATEVGLSEDEFAAVLYEANTGLPEWDGRTDKYSMDYQTIDTLMIPILQKTVRRVDEHELRISDVETRSQDTAAQIAVVEDRIGTQAAQIESLQEQLADARLQIAEQAAELAQLRGQRQAIA